MQVYTRRNTCNKKRRPFRRTDDVSQIIFHCPQTDILSDGQEVCNHCVLRPANDRPAPFTPVRLPEMLQDSLQEAVRKGIPEPDP